MPVLRAMLEPWSFEYSDTLITGHGRLNLRPWGFLTAVGNTMVCSVTLYSQVGTLADVDGWCDPRREGEILDGSANNHILIDAYMQLTRHDAVVLRCHAPVQKVGSCSVPVE